MSLKPQKRLGQHFLKDPQVVHDLIAAAEVGPSDVVLEVGAGTGVVTQELAKRAAKVIAVEFDRELIPILQANLSKQVSNGRVEIIQADVLEYQIPDTVTKIVGSIPYQITSPLIHKIAHEITTTTLLIQKEVAQKICARPPRASYLSNFVGLVGKAEIVRIVKPGAFNPPPKVDSAIIKITPKRFEVRSFSSQIGPSKSRQDQLQKLEKFLHYAFSHPRKMLHHTFDREKLEQVGIPPTARPQEVELKKWLELARAYALDGVES